ncbi:MAG: hypothetical protein EOO56_18785 [Hymenobacter sp.]|nr:MAG: hypothetical protein EOO56_18785 [Hymenobacter sp.]
MKLATLLSAGSLAGLASLLAACHPATSEDRLPAEPLLEAVPAGYCPVDRQDMLRSYWAAPAVLANSSFDLTSAYLGQFLG